MKTTLARKVDNWPEYNTDLCRRGEALFEMTDVSYDVLYHSGSRKRGGVQEYSDAMYELLLTIKTVYRFPWRLTTGFVKAFLKKSFPGRRISVPNYAHASRVCAKLSLKIKTYGIPKGEGLVIALDSTGVNVYSSSGWHQRKHGKGGRHRKREQWKKIHVTFDTQNKQILSFAITDSNTNDCEVAGQLIADIDEPLARVLADGAYDTHEFHRQIAEREADPLIPPDKKCKAQGELKKPGERKPHLDKRDAIIGKIREYPTFEEGLKEWKKASGYHQRSLVEVLFSRYKRAFGFSFQHWKDSARLNEVIVKINMLNKYAEIARPVYS